MARNKIEDLRDHLFAQLERLNDEELKGDELAAECKRAKAVAEISKEIVESSKVEVDFLKITGALKGSTYFSELNPKNLLPNAD